MMEESKTLAKLIVLRAGYQVEVTSEGPVVLPLDDSSSRGFCIKGIL